MACVDIERPGAPGHVPYQPGGMGIHFLNMSVVGPLPDPAHPSVLIYEPDGAKLRLVAAEWFIPLATGVKGRPQLLHVPFDGPMEGHMPLMPMDLHHWDLHVWLFKSNPRGMFKRHESEREVPRLLTPPSRRSAEARARPTAMTDPRPGADL